MTQYTDSEIALPESYTEDDWGAVYQNNHVFAPEYLTNEQLTKLKEQLAARIFARKMHKFKIKYSEELFLMLEKEEQRRKEA